jgi:hypothetical protein
MDRFRPWMTTRNIIGSATGTATNAVNTRLVPRGEGTVGNRIWRKTDDSSPSIEASWCLNGRADALNA